ncbi:hypothetical protein FNZ18_20445 [Salmonella enterica subsp. salamae]|nr:hypothetical protein [Salmonella enterica subsp. salamae]
MEQQLMKHPDSEREHNKIVAEYQAYVIEKLIKKFNARVTWWLVDCGYEERTVALRWSEIGANERHIYNLELVKFARQIAWKHFRS